MHEKRFAGEIERLRSAERVERLEVERVTALCLEGLKVSGVDANPEMLAAARQFVPTGDFREGTAEALPYPDGSFDLVFLGLVLHESDEPLKSLQEARRVARQRVCILEWPYREGLFGPPLAHRLKPEDLIDWFQKAGYRKWTVTGLIDTALYCLKV
jgi:ubiquinone/menaquinone biosynthesis C-methylase UbiE